LLLKAAKNGTTSIDLRALGIDGEMNEDMDMEAYMAQKAKEIEEMEKPWEQKLKE